jgi:hypothetical protein
LRVITSLIAAEVLANNGNVETAHQHLDSALAAVQVMPENITVLFSFQDVQEGVL